MSSPESVNPQHNPEVAPDSVAVQLPLDEVRVEAMELDNDEADLLELGVQLESIAQDVIKNGDGITAQAQLDASGFLITPTVLLGGEIAIFGSVSQHSPNTVAAGTFAGMTAAAILQFVSDRKATKKIAPIQIPEGYSIQCLRANAASLAFDDREAVAFIHTRTYADNEQQSTGQARDRLRDALTVIEAAPTITKAVLPASALRAAHLPHHSSKTYQETLIDMHPDVKVDSPYKDSELSVVLSSAAAKRLAEVLQGAPKHSSLHHTIDALSERFPLASLQLAEAVDDNERLIPILHTLLRRTLDGELPSSQRERGHDGPIYYDRIVPLLIHTNTTDKFDPLIMQRRAADFAPVETKRLSQMTGDQELLLADLGERLESRSYTDLQLVSIALRLTERRGTEEAEASTAVQEMPADPLVGSDPIAIRHNTENRPFKSKAMRRSLGRIATAGLVGVLVSQGLTVGLHALEAVRPQEPGVIFATDVVWRVDEHGIPAAGYYTQSTYNHYDTAALEWSGKTASIRIDDSLPTTLQNPQEKYLLVSGITNSSTVDLAIRQGTQLSAVSTRTESGQEIDHHVYTFHDNTINVKVENNREPYQLTYQLTPDDTYEQAPFADRTVSVTDADLSAVNPNVFPHYKGRSAYFPARYIADTFTYDASTGMRDKLNGTHTANEYLHTIYSTGRCDCVECATAAALLTERMQPGQKVLLGTGYLHRTESGTDHGYLDTSESHAWLIDSNGTIIDATAQKTDKDSNVPIHRPVANVDAEMRDGGWSNARKVADNTTASSATAANQNEHDPWDGLHDMALTGLGTLALAGLWHEARKRTLIHATSALLRNGQWLAAAAEVRPGKAASAMAWQAYGNSRTPMPSYQPGQTIPIVDNVATGTLQEIASGTLRTDPQLTRRERRGIRRMAKLLLVERRRGSSR